MLGSLLSLIAVWWLVSVLYDRGAPLMVYPALALTYYTTWARAHESGGKLARNRIIADLESEADDLSQAADAEAAVGRRIPGVHKDTRAHADALRRACRIASGREPGALTEESTT